MQAPVVEAVLLRSRLGGVEYWMGLLRDAMQKQCADVEKRRCLSLYNVSVEGLSPSCTVVLFVPSWGGCKRRQAEDSVVFVTLRGVLESIGLFRAGLSESTEEEHEKCFLPIRYQSSGRAMEGDEMHAVYDIKCGLEGQCLCGSACECSILGGDGSCEFSHSGITRAHYELEGVWR